METGKVCLKVVLRNLTHGEKTSVMYILDIMSVHFFIHQSFELQAAEMDSRNRKEVYSKGIRIAPKSGEARGKKD